MAKRKADFSAKTRTALALRAAYHCSNPGCGMATARPGVDPGDALRLGRAAHITSAEPGGPRYDAALSDEERRAATNGIHLCANCAGMIDVNNGKDYPVRLLQEWKNTREDEVRDGGRRMTELAGVVKVRGVGDLTGADIQGPTRFAPGTRISVKGIGRLTGVKIGDGK
jgi:hypothetical protein